MAPLDFDALRDLHNSVNDLLHSPFVQQAIVHQRDQEKWVNEASEASLRMLDVCGLSKDVLLLVKQHLQDLQFTLRRASIGEPAEIRHKITAFNVYRKKLKKESLQCLKRLNSKTMISVSNVAIRDQNLALVVDVLREVRMASTCIVESLVSLIFRPWLDHKSAGKRILASKLARVSGQTMITTDYLLYDVVMLKSVNKRLEGAQEAIEDLELELECMMRRLIHTRVLLLNVWC